jgi:NADPH-dependent 2,4-dienoyl-CoA reductase/sulfur reductase-like enzyme
VRLPVAILGNGAAAAEAIIALRQNGFEHDIHVFADNDHPPYNPMLGTYLVSGSISPEQAFPFGDRRAFYEGNKVTVHPNEAVVDLDAEMQTFTTATGATHSYEHCLVATGARPAVPPVAGLREALAEVPGALRQRVFTIQTLAGVLRLKQAVEVLLAGGTGASRAAVIGASFAGIKIASVLREMGMDVILVERESSILPLSAHPECACILERHLLEEGYELRLGAALSSVTPHSSGVRLDFGALPGAADPGGTGGTACEDYEGQQEVDLVVLCTGTRPSLSFLEPGQLDTGAGILVDEELRSNIPTLHAAGDVAQGKNVMSGRHEIIGLWASARNQGRAAGRSIAGVPTGYRGSVPNNIAHVGRMLFAGIGCLREYDRIETLRRGAAFRLQAWQEGRLVGVNYIDSCLDVGVTKQALVRAATGATADTEATWTNFSA